MSRPRTAKTHHGRPCKRCGTTEKYSASYNCVECTKTRMKKRKAMDGTMSYEQAMDFLRTTDSELIGVFLKDDKIIGYVGREEVLTEFRKRLT